MLAGDKPAALGLKIALNTSVKSPVDTPCKYKAGMRASKLGTRRRYADKITHQKTDGGRLLDWHREQTGTVEHTHDEVKNQLGGGHVPSRRFGVNSAWFKVSLLTYNLVSAIKGLCLAEEERTARMKRFRLLLIQPNVRN